MNCGRTLCALGVSEDLHVVQFSTNTKAMPKVLMVLDASGQIRNAISLQVDATLPDPSGPAGMSGTATGSVAVLDLLTGHTEQVYVPSTDIQQAEGSLVVFFFKTLLWAGVSTVLIEYIATQLPPLAPWQRWLAKLVLHSVVGTFVYYIDQHDNLSPVILWQTHTEETFLGHTTVYVCAFTGNITHP